MKHKDRKEKDYITNNFKLWIVSTVFLLIFIHLCSIYKYWPYPLISGETILCVVLALVGYLWIQELRDRYRLMMLNKALIEAHRRIEREELDVIATLVLTEEAKDPYARGHSRRTARVALAIAQQMDFSDENKMIIERACLLHDIGKIGIDSEILMKPEKLDDMEWSLVKKHPKRAVEILGPLEFLHKEKKIIYHHHERYDGAGYPEGLKGEAIPLESRIISVADTFDAMSVGTSYLRKPFQPDYIIEELKKVSGRQLDPAIVDTFLDVLKKDPALWKKD